MASAPKDGPENPTKLGKPDGSKPEKGRRLPIRLSAGRFRCDYDISQLEQAS
jgi:hypothetical protein